MKKIRTVAVGPQAAMPFLLGEKEQFVIAPLGYVDINNPGADAIFKPLDSTKIKITKGKLFENNLTEYLVENTSDAGVNIEIYQEG